MTNAKDMRYLSTGWDANALADKVFQVRQELEYHRTTSLAKLEKFQEDKPIKPIMQVVLWLMAFGWLFITITEYFVSCDVYAVVLSSSEDSIKPILAAVSMGFFAVVLSGLLCELIHPVFSTYFNSSEEDPFRQVTLDRHQKTFNRKYVYFIVGAIGTIGAIYFLYILSEYRVYLENQAEISTGGFTSNVWISPVYYFFEIATGMALPFVVSLAWYRHAAFRVRRKDLKLDRRQQKLTSKCLETFGLSTIQREASDSDIAPAPVSKELRALIAEKYGEDAIKNEGSEIPGSDIPDTEDPEASLAVETPIPVSPTDNSGEAALESDEPIEEADNDEGEAELLRVIDQLVDEKNCEL